MQDDEVYETIQLLPLEKYLLRNKTQPNDEISSSKLLANIPILPLDFKIQLEQIGVFDLTDLNKVQPQFLKELNVSIADFEYYQELANKYHTQQKLKIAVVIDLPKNYALINILSNEKILSISVHWNGILITLSSSTNLGWLPLKGKFEQNHKKQGYPTLIGVIDVNSMSPDWLRDLTEISTFLSGYNPALSLNDQALKMGFPQNFKHISILDENNKTVLQMQFILDLALQPKIQPKIPV